MADELHDKGYLVVDGIDGKAHYVALLARTELQHRPVADGERVNGVYRRSVMLARGRFAMLDDGLGFRLVPWRPAIERRLGQAMGAMVRGSGVSWAFGRNGSRS